ncbi:quinone-dependent dihydroorotate dehydrogenase [Lyngbya confervoides]|uniref:Dihydroorotate dehydrogenase (quinone) n=1 Tax=Lyngbya confervoides BDU141951 TaxID=1574623 RepID=A0ABD4T1G8_9CYAN|nr:quinone-dependent dihydroorotate dehydrogenase [Lyngbya confervoides]MCM1982488.1 quinone-dependent dihydroorotate dehydrogenase [Lyngbya confervoides BDU141951]
MNLYKTLLRPMIFSGFRADPETVQRQLMGLCAQGDRAYANPWVQWSLDRLGRQLGVQDPRLSQDLWHLSFPNPVGLAAGFDKDGVASNIWPHLGFGFTEVGTVTHQAQPGNPRPRLFRLPEDLAAINRMGFNNQGAAVMAQTLKEARSRRRTRTPLGINLGKSKVTPLDRADQDYVQSFRLLQSLGDYFVINVSSPNTPGLRSLQAVEQLAPIIGAIMTENTSKKPILLKISPDLALEDLRAVVDLAQAQALAGIIATNTTIQRSGLKTQRIPATGQAPQEEAGGLSGMPVRDRATAMIRLIWQQTQGTLPVIGVGGIFTAEDAWAKITAGASLVQVYTGWLYEGPTLVRQILEGLIQKLDEYQIDSLQDAVGLDHQ